MRAGRTRGGTAALGLLLAVLLAGGCAVIPTDSAITSGSPAVPDRPVREVAAGPAAGVRPAELVAGFLAASPGAPDEYAVARSFLTPERARTWRPEETTVVYSGTLPAPSVSGEVVDVPGAAPAGGAADADAGGDAVRARVEVPVVATIDADGRYVPAPSGLVQTVELVLRRSAGQWRIDELPDLVLVSEPDFGFQYRSYPLWYLDPTQQVLVPEQRWLPTTGATATRLVSELLGGASPWLLRAVRTAVPAGTALAPPRSVTIDSGVAVLELTGQARVASGRDRALMRAQLLATLQPVLGVTDVELRVDGGRLDVPPNVRLPRADPGPVGDPVLVEGSSVVRLVGRGLAPVEGLASLEGLDPSHPAVSLDGGRYAVLTSQRSELRLLAAGLPESEPALRGFDLTAPSFDRRGWVWSASAASDGTVRAVSPSGEWLSVEAGWLAGRRVTSLRVGRDGTRVVVASTDEDGVGHVDVAGIERTADGTPVELAPAPSRSVATQLTTVREAVWIDADELAVLGSEGGGDPLVHLAAVGGPRRPPRAPLAGITAVAGGDGPRSVLVTLADGSVLTPSGAGWAELLAAGQARDAAFPG
ncbi:MAG TPA: LpqB family beta-propeller domain-containing protein [Mycobacteriales bacterium]|nr:LpqB family beta-propeller domain-containing protein [Mycobacteriales bacterium]